MKTIETTATVTSDGKLIVQVSPDIPPGEHKIVLVIDETPLPPKVRTPKPPLKLRTLKLDAWPADCTFRREDLYGDGGR